ncbi:MAG: LysM peptidoglycan-binding domain-containing protein [Chloroflexota bacterium]|nr:LysM peptidoglycan-binding domain-containing protein [Chloroflexota bacterium]
MLFRSLFMLLVLALPLPAHAAAYVVHRGDTLGQIAVRYGVPIQTLAGANGITDTNLVPAGRVLLIPSVGVSPQSGRAIHYRVRWGDTLSGISVTFHTPLQTLRSLNPRLGAYLLAGQILVLCASCGTAIAPAAVSTGSGGYTVRPGDTLSGIAARYGVTTAALRALNGISNPNRVLAGMRLAVPAASGAAYRPVSSSSSARALIVEYAQEYNVAPSFALGIAWQESGFNQAMVSSTGAVGVMQLEPASGDHVSWLLGRTFNIYDLRDNVQAGVYWVSRLLTYYGGNERVAAAAYYQGARSLQRRGWFQDTVQYVSNVEALKSRFGG